MRTITLHTVFRDSNTEESVDVIFSGVVAHAFEHELPVNILLDIEETDVPTIVHGHSEIFSKSWRWGWPPVEYGGDLHALIAKLQSLSVRAYTIDGSLGLCGWVLAKSCERILHTKRPFVEPNGS